MHTVGTARAWAIGEFKRAQVESPELSADLLLGFVLGWDRIRVLSRPGQLLRDETWVRFRNLIDRRAKGEPFQYLTGEQEFYGRAFRVTPEVLIPRPETELLVEEALNLIRRQSLPGTRFADIGAGSGCIAVTVASEIPTSAGWAIDISAAALQVARENAARHGVAQRIQFVQADLLECFLRTPHFDFLLSNPPYVAFEEYDSLPSVVRNYEPRGALFGDESGLGIYRRLIPGISSRLVPGGYLLLELGAGQAEQVGQLIETEGLSLQRILDDLQGIPRCLVARKLPGETMDKIRVIGGISLAGRVEISGAKNATLPAMAASLLTADAIHLENVPYVRDILTTCNLLQDMGVEADVREDGIATLKASDVRSYDAPYELVKTMRAAILVLGPLVGRFKKARVSLPGGCAIGARPVNLHIMGLERMGAKCDIVHGYVEASTNGLHGSYILMDTVTVTGTENLMMAATLADGETVLDNAACEPEISDLAGLLRGMGAHIEGDGTRTIRIHGVKKLHGCRHRVIPDRVEAGTFAIASAITRGDVEVANCHPRHLTAVLTQLSQTGAEVNIGPDSFRVRGRDPISSKNVATYPYPAFPTDMQAQYMALMTQGDGSAVITETIFENRFMHALEMIRMGADITIDGRQALIKGGRPLTGARVLASDLRASASLILAGLVAKGETWIDRVYHLDRGYYHIEEKLARLGANIERIR